MTALYNINKTFQENFDAAHIHSVPIPKRVWPNREHWHTFLGYPVASRIGIPACAVTTGPGIVLAAALGFDILTYKTIRSRAFAGYSLPNICYVQPSILQQTELQNNIMQATTDLPDDIAKISISNSFGNACFSPAEVTKDILHAKKSMAPGQVLIVSIYGEPSVDQDDENRDFIAAATIAKNAGADVIEANISCPNIIGGTATLLPQRIFSIVNNLVKTVGNLPVIIKLGWPALTHLTDILAALADAGGQGMCGINSVPMQIRNYYNQPIFGQQRIFSGVSGYPIRQLALIFIEFAQSINQQKNLGLTILGTGGVTLPEHFTELHNRGADIALSATGMMWNPYLANQYHHSLLL